MNSQSMNQELYLNLNNFQLFGWESQVYDSTLHAILLGIEHKDNFPPVHITHLKDLNFAISTVKLSDSDRYDTYDGGHHRQLHTI